jgi:hypothetical protein
MSILDGLPRIWSGSDDGVNATRLFRKTFSVTGCPCSARLTLFAESVFHVWVNGAYLGRGPGFHHPLRRPETVYSIADRLRPGTNVIAVLVHASGVSLHNQLPAQTPGLVASVTVETLQGTLAFGTGDGWKAAPSSGWNPDTPRRSWAIGFVESFDARTAPPDWQKPDFQDARWPEADMRPAFPAGEGVYFDPGLPPLRYTFKPAAQLLYAGATAGASHPLAKQDKCSDFAQSILNEPWSASRSYLTDGPSPANGALTLDHLDPAEHAVLIFDLGAQHTGGVLLELQSDSEGTLDIGWAELLLDGKPAVLRKGNSYCDRVHARAGRTRWMPAGFSSGRYLLLVLRGFKGRVAFSRLGWLASEPDLPWLGRFTCSDPALTAVWRLCERTQRVGTQEGLMDCPTREQAPYIGDGNPCAAWIHRLTGSAAYWKHLVGETFAVQADNGLVKSTVFSGIANILLDYVLLAVVGVRDYVRETGDVETARAVLPGCRKTIEGFLRQCNADGFFAFDWEQRDHAQFKEPSGPPLQPASRWIQPPAVASDPLRNPFLNVFIDHPGLGWHNVGEPGIDRRGLNAAMNALLVLALRAYAELLERAGEPEAGRYRETADRLAAKSAALFWNEAEQAFADGFRNGELLPQVSQQTNAWCVAAGFVSGDRAKALLRRILDRTDADLTRCGPYFYFYLLPVLAENGLMPEALDEIRRWEVMLKNGATCLWETFNGDHLDSYCHPWSGAPVDFLPRYLAGIGPVPADARTVDLRPAWPCLDTGEAVVLSARGPVSLKWERTGTSFTLSGSLPDGLTGRLLLPDGSLRTVKGNWSFSPS